MSVDKAAIFSHIIEQQVDDAAFLWLLRSQASGDARYTAATLGKLEQRLQNHLNGAMAAPGRAWEYALQGAERKEGGESFVVAILAFGSADKEKIARALAIGAENSETLEGLVSALGWLPEATVYPWLKPWIGGGDPFQQYLAIATSSIRRLDPLHYLSQLLGDKQALQNVALHSRMLRLVGEIKRHDLMPALINAQSDKNPDIAFWGGWSALLLGERSALAGMEPYVMQSGPWQAAAIQLAFRHKSNTPLWQWLNTLTQTPGQSIAAIEAVAAQGDPQGVEWLLSRMQEPAYARAAGEAFSTITGIDLQQSDLTAPPSDADDEAQEEGDARYLPMPDAEKVSRCWQQIAPRFSADSRYLLGEQLQPERLQQLLRHGQQRHRAAAALEFALLAPANPYPNSSITIHHRDRKWIRST